MELDLPFIWAGIIAFAVLAYVVLDGFDLGIGILFPFLPDEQDRDVMMNSVAPVWDGNETWLVLGGGGLFAVFPLAYAVMMPALYMPIIADAAGAGIPRRRLRIRWRTKRWKPVWDVAFAGGSTIAALMQGIALGALVQGIEVQRPRLCRRLVGLADAVLAAHRHCRRHRLRAAWRDLAGAEDRRRTAEPDARRAPGRLRCATLGFIGLVSLLTPFQDPVYFQRWFAWPGIVLSLPVPLLVALAAWSLITGLRNDRDLTPFLAALSLFILSFAGIGISFYPYIVPPTLTIWEAAAPDASLAFTLVGAVILIPLILAYTAYSYWVFRGKIDPDAGYH